MGTGVWGNKVRAPVLFVLAWAFPLVMPPRLSWATPAQTVLNASGQPASRHTRTSLRRSRNIPHRRSVKALSPLHCGVSRNLCGAHLRGHAISLQPYAEAKMPNRDAPRPSIRVRFAHIRCASDCTLPLFPTFLSRRARRRSAQRHGQSPTAACFGNIVSVCLLVMRARRTALPIRHIRA